MNSSPLFWKEAHWECVMGSYSVHVQRVDGEVVGVHVKVVEDFFERDLLAAFLQNHPVRLRLVRALYELQQMLLVHAGSGVYVGVHLCLTEQKPISLEESQ